ANVSSFLLSLLGSLDLGTLDRKRLLNKTTAKRVSRYLGDYADSKNIYTKITYVNPDHVHMLVDIPTSLSIEELAHLLKGSSSHWINSNDIVTGKFAWSRGYGAFSVSQSNVNRVVQYIAQQEEHHRTRTFGEELQEFINRHGLRWKDEGSR